MYESEDAIHQKIASEDNFDDLEQREEPLLLSSEEVWLLVNKFLNIVLS